MNRLYWVITRAMVVGMWLAMIGCSGGGRRTADLLVDVRAFNEGVRWGKFPQAAVRISPAERSAFLDLREDLEEELQIDDFEITRVERAAAGQDTARIQIRWTWHLDAQGIVRTTTSNQNWQRYGKRWLLLEEYHLRGDEMPGILPQTPQSKEGSHLREGGENTRKGPEL